MQSTIEKGTSMANYVGARTTQALTSMTTTPDDGPTPDEAEGEAPPFRKSKECYVCHVTFSTLQTPRHHCRNCGESFCHKCSKNVDYVPFYGRKAVVRTCDRCHEQLVCAAFAKRIEYRTNRVQQFFEGKLEPFVESYVDTNTEKTKRGAMAAVTVLKNAPGVGAVAQGVATSVDFLAKYGMAGAAGLLMRNEFVQIVDAVKEMMGDVETLSMHELSGALYYMMANQRRLRGEDPALESKEHAGCPELKAGDADNLFSYAPLGCTVPYLDSEVDMQRLLQFRGYRLLFANVKSEREQPAFYLAASDAKREVVLGIRGTQSLHDVVTDLKVVPEKFAPGIEKAVAGTDENYEKWASECKTFAHSGMARAALWLSQEVGACLEMFRKSAKGEYSLTVTGHSLGAGVASLFSMINKKRYPSLTCYAFATPAVADPPLSESCGEYVTTVIMHNDVVPRGTIHSLKDLLAEALTWKSKWRVYFAEDYEAYKDRVMGVWTPRRRVEAEHAGEDPAKAKARAKRRRDLEEEVRKIEEQERKEEEKKKKSKGYQHHKISTANQAEVAEFNADPESSIEDVNRKDVPLLCPPGRIVHIYIDECGVHRAAVTKHDNPSLRRIELYDDLADDHKSEAYLYALRSIHNRNHMSPKKPPPFVAFDKHDVCPLCEARFTWTSTSDSVAQRAIDTGNCHCCGTTACPGCLSNRMALVEYGIPVPQPVCDKCFYRAV